MTRKTAAALRQTTGGSFMEGGTGRMEEIASFATGVAAAALLVSLMEFMFPAGAMKSAVKLGTGIVFLAYVADRIVGIFADLGV